MAYLLGFLAATVSASAFPRGRGQCDLASFTPSQCRARISQHCANIWPMCDANAACHRAHLCLDEHDAASMSAAQPCFPGQAEGLLSRVAECLADCLPESQPPSCLSRGGLTVDWWFMYKLPGGLNYAYHDSTGEVHEDPTSINPMPNSSMGALGGTVAPVFAAKETGSEDLAYVVYNDQPPDGVQPLHTLPTYDKGAHAKGILATDGAVGFWLIHSIPKLPDLRGSQYSYSGSTKFGQSLLCLSLSAAGTEQVATQLRTAHPIIYAASVPSGLQAALPTLSRLTQGQFASVNTSSAPLQTRGVSGTAPLALMSHIKSPLWGANIYEQVVLPQLNEAGVGAMVWETWRRNPFTLDSFCPPEFPLPSLNAINISFPCGSGGVKCQYHYTSDHSKWGISRDSGAAKAGPPYVCIGGINRMSSQQQRGGGTVCFKHKNLHVQLGRLIAVEESCSSLPTGTPLKMLAGQLRVGTQIVDSSSTPYSMDAEQPFHQIWTSQFNLFAWRNCSSWSVIRPNETAKDFHCADRLAHYAQTQGVVAGNPLRLAALFLGPLVPADIADNAWWVVKRVQGKYSQVALQNLLLDHVDSVTSHFVEVCAGKGAHNPFADYATMDFNAMVVVADAMGPNGTFKPAGTTGMDNIWALAWSTADGQVPGWLSQPYLKARAKAPGLPLLYADSGLGISGPKANGLLTQLQAARNLNRDAAPDGVMFRLQCGSATNECTSTALSSAIDLFASNGFPVWLSVSFGGSVASHPARRTMSLEAMYHAVALACVGAKATCRAILLEGFSDRYCPDGPGSSCLLDGSYGVKTAFTRFQQGLSHT